MRMAVEMAILELMWRRGKMRGLCVCEISKMYCGKEPKHCYARTIVNKSLDILLLEVLKKLHRMKMFTRDGCQQWPRCNGRGPMGKCTNAPQ
jgi:hypothetical protein